MHKRWSLYHSQPLAELTYNYLEFAHSPEHGPVVLKMGCPNPELETEIKALKVYRDLDRAVKLMDWDTEQGVLLLERIFPGHDLTSLPDDQEATHITADAILALRCSVPPGNEFPTMEKWCKGFDRYQTLFSEKDGPLPIKIFSTAVGLVRELLASSEEREFLHGDLHHTNLLFRDDDTWIAIDPKGVIGELAFEVGPYVFNPIPDLIHRPNLGEILSQRLQILEETTGIDKYRLAAWSFCRAVLAAIWSLEEGETHLDYWIAIAEMIQQRMK
jgi:streptomycin 6-kinase